MKDRVLDLIGEDTNRLKDYSRDEVGRYLNDTYRQLVSETCALENQFWFQIVEGTATYTLPENMGEIQRITHRDRRIVLLSTYELDRIEETWEDETGEIDAYTVFQRDSGVIRVYRNPDYDDAEVLSNDYGTIVAFVNEDDSYDTTNYNFFYASLSASLGVVTDYEETDETVTFAAAGDGGGADADYGTVVDVTDSTETGRYTFDSEYGVVVDMTDSEEEGLSAVAFESATESTLTDEFGIVIDVRNEDRVFVFNQQEGVNRPVETGELGTEVWWKNDDEILEVWADTVPLHLVEDGETTRLPRYMDMAIVYGAASKALRKLASARDEAISAAYAALYLAWQKLLTDLSRNSTKETSRGFGQTINGARRVRRGPRLPGEYPRV